MLRKILSMLFSACLIAVTAGSLLLVFFLAIQLPNVSQLKDVHFQVPLRVFTADGKLIAEFGEKRRIPIKINDVPPMLIRAVLDTEDHRYYQHKGVDFIGLIRAAKQVLITGRKAEGGSTITMQVARNFFLSLHKTYLRKIEEILLAFKIDREFDKNTILELYLNKVNFGERAYGVAAAAQIYFNKDLQQLTLAEMATIAGLPQAPSRNNPITNPKGAVERRNTILRKMLEYGDITTAQYKVAVSSPLTVYHSNETEVLAPYAAEMARVYLVQKYGTEVYDSGLKVYLTIDSLHQNIANKYLRGGIIDYAKRHNLIAPEKNLSGYDYPDEWLDELSSIAPINGLWPAAVIKVNNSTLTLLLKNNQTVVVAKPTNTTRPLRLGDVVRLDTLANTPTIVPMPKVNGALVAMNPQNGAILAMVGGFSYAKDNFNCVTQATRQPGSSLKPFIYSAALEKGFTLASIINDAPIIINDYSGIWRPQNFTREFAGPIRFRRALVESRNLVSIRILQAIGIPYARDYLERFGFRSEELPSSLSLALGTASVSPLELTAAYAVFANGGYRVEPFLITKIQDQDNKVLLSIDPTTIKKDANPPVITARNVYLMTDVMKDVLKHAAGMYSLPLSRSDLAGKTGTTNEQQDAWFAGFNPNLVAAVWFGYNRPQSIHEYGAQVALPIWLNFMQEALQNSPEINLPMPEGVVSAKIDPATGLLAYPGQENAMFELFFNDNVPTQTASMEESPAAVGAPATNGTNAAKGEGISLGTEGSKDEELF